MYISQIKGPIKEKTKVLTQKLEKAIPQKN